MLGLSCWVGDKVLGLLPAGSFEAPACTPGGCTADCSEEPDSEGITSDTASNPGERDFGVGGLVRWSVDGIEWRNFQGARCSVGDTEQRSSDYMQDLALRAAGDIEGQHWMDSRWSIVDIEQQNTNCSCRPPFSSSS